jgi:hypothetical protein
MNNMARIITIELIKEELRLFNPGYKLLSVEYINARTKLKFLCDKGHIFYMTYDKLRIGRRCVKCNHKFNIKNTNRDYCEKNGYNIDDVRLFLKKEHPKAKLLSKKYINSRTKLKIECESGHIFHMSFSDLLGSKLKKGFWCKFCSGKNKKTIEDIKNYLNDNHPNSKLLSTKYINAFGTLVIKCEKGHEFKSDWHRLSRGMWCFECKGNKKPTLKEIQEFLDVNHLGAKLLSKEYKNNCSKLHFVCEKGHFYNASWNSVKSGSWCFECNGKKKLTLDEIQDFLDKHHNGSKLLSIKYIKAQSKLDIICENGHEIKQSWNKIKSGKWCIKCSGNEKKTIDTIKNHINKHFPGSILLSTKYISNVSKLNVKCKHGHIFQINWASMQKNWCPYCKDSFVESFCRRTIEYYFKRPFLKVRPSWLKNPKTNYRLELDGFNEELGIAFECDGEQHYKYPNFLHNSKKLFINQQERDRLKNKLCKENGIELVRIKAFGFNSLDEFRKIILSKF